MKYTELRDTRVAITDMQLKLKLKPEVETSLIN